MVVENECKARADHRKKENECKARAYHRKKRKTDEGIKKDNEESTKNGRIQHRYSPCSDINLSPKDEQFSRRVDLIKYLGFEFVFHMKMMNIDSELLEFIIDRWDEGTKCINLDDGKKISITEDDVYRVYGLPRGPNVVEFDLKESAKTTLGRKFVSTCSTKGNIVDDDLLLCLEKEVDDERWVKLYILLIFCKLFGSVQSRVVTAEDLKFLEPHMIQYFNQFNWCQHVCDHVCDIYRNLSLQKFKSSVDSLQKVKPSVDGDLHFLLVCYLDRTTVGRDHRSVSIVVPTCQVWTDKKIRDRKKAVGDQFGSSAFSKVSILSDPPVSSSSGTLKWVPMLVWDKISRDDKLVEGASSGRDFPYHQLNLSEKNADEWKVEKGSKKNKQRNQCDVRLNEPEEEILDASIDELTCLILSSKDDAGIQTRE